MGKRKKHGVEHTEETMEKEVKETMYTMESEGDQFDPVIIHEGELSILPEHIIPGPVIVAEKEVAYGPVASAQLIPIAINKYTVRFRVEKKEGAFHDISHVTINRNVFSDDPDFSLGFIAADLNVKPIDPNEERMLTKVQKEAREKMKAKQREFQDMLNLKLLIIRA